MNAEQQLRAALDSRAATAAPNPAALAEIRRRAERRRWTSRLQVGVASVAVAGVAAGAFALTDERTRLEPTPPAASTPPEPTPEPSVPASASPSPAASPSPSAVLSGPAGTVSGPAGRDEFVALLEDGRLVVVSASTGRISRTVTTLDRTDSGRGASVELSPDRRTVYVETNPNDGCGGTITSYDIDTGADSRAADGTQPAVSQDGRMLAYLDDCGEQPVVHVRDLATGSVRRYAHSMDEVGTHGEREPWRLIDLTWHADGRRIWLAMEWENMTHLRLLDPATDRTTADAERVYTKFATLSLERRGARLVYLHRCCFPEFEEDSLILVRGSDGSERELVRSPASGGLGAPEVGPDGDLLYVESGRLFRLDVESGQATDLGASTALARDW